MLSAGLTITFIDDINDEKVVWQFADGVVEYLGEQLEGLETLPPGAFCAAEATDGERAGAFALSCFPKAAHRARKLVNLIPTAQGGTHVNGLRTGILEAYENFVTFTTCYLATSSSQVRTCGRGELHLIA